MKGVEPEGAVVRECAGSRSRWKRAPVFADTRLAIIINWQPKKAVLLKIEDQLGEPLRGVLKVVDLPASDQVEGIEFVPFGNRNEGVGLRINSEQVRIIGLEKIGVAKKIYIGGRVDVVSYEKPVLKANAVAPVCAVSYSWLVISSDGYFR